MKDNILGRKKELEHKIKRLKLKQKVILVCFLLCIFPYCYLSISFAKYVTTEVRERYLLSKEFYFYSDILNGETYTMNDWDGESNYTFNAILNNFADELRWTKENITYTVETTCDASISGSVSCSANGGTISTDSFRGSSNIVNISLTNPNSLEFENGDTVTVDVSITSTFPYRKTLSATFVIGINKKDVSYRIEDVVNQNYFDLVLSNYTKNTKNVTLNWTNMIHSISVDNTNQYFRLVPSENITTYIYNGITYINGFSYSMSAKSSSKIRFFKNDITQNYTYPIVNANSIIGVTVN